MRYIIMETRKQYYIEHSATGKQWSTHKYIAKIGNRYIYTREQLAAAKGAVQKRLSGLGNAASSKWEAVKKAASSAANSAASEAKKDIRKLKATKNSAMSQLRTTVREKKKAYQMEQTRKEQDKAVADKRNRHMSSERKVEAGRNSINSKHYNYVEPEVTPKIRSDVNKIVRMNRMNNMVAESQKRQNIRSRLGDEFDEHPNYFTDLVSKSDLERDKEKNKYRELTIRKKRLASYKKAHPGSTKPRKKA